MAQKYDGGEQAKLSKGNNPSHCLLKVFRAHKTNVQMRKAFGFEAKSVK